MKVFLAEWRKLRRPTFFFGTIGSVIFVTGLITSLFFLLIESGSKDPDRSTGVTREMLENFNGFTLGFNNASGLLGLVALTVFASQMAQEYSHGTLRNLLVRQPRRIYLLAGKYSAMVSFAFVTVIISAATSIGIAFALSGRAKVSTENWFSNESYSAFGHSFVNVFISTIGFGTIGMLLGLLFRSPISSISIGTIYMMIVENILIATWKPSANWAPGSLLNVIANGGEPIGMTTYPSYSQALLRISIYLISASFITAWLFKRRDVAN